jgi:hypothetical protein
MLRLLHYQVTVATTNSLVIAMQAGGGVSLFGSNRRSSEQCLSGARHEHVMPYADACRLSDLASTSVLFLTADYQF